MGGLAPTTTVLMARSATRTKRRSIFTKKCFVRVVPKSPPGLCDMPGVCVHRGQSLFGPQPETSTDAARADLGTCRRGTCRLRHSQTRQHYQWHSLSLELPAGEQRCMRQSTRTNSNKLSGLLPERLGARPWAADRPLIDP